VLQDLSSSLPIAFAKSPRGYNSPVSHRRLTGRSPTAALALAVLLGQLSLSAQSRSLAPYVPTPSDVVDRMLTLAKVGPRDVVYDLGCGDGRIVIAAAQRFGARGVGVDIDANLINQAEANAKTAGVDRRVKFLVQDAMTVDVSDATVVTLYLLSASNVKLRPILTRQLRRGARIVSHSFAMGDWEPEVVDTFRDANGTSRTLYLWTTDGKPRP
jgi:SAM-dependent methyltransferase